MAAERAVTLVAFAKSADLTDRQLRRLVRDGLPVTRRGGVMRVLPSKVRAWLNARRAGRGRMREAIHREHEVRAGDLARRIQEIARDYLPAAVVDATWSRLTSWATGHLRTWPDVLAPRLGTITARTTGFAGALEAEAVVRELLFAMVAASPHPEAQAAEDARPFFVTFTKPLPADATPRERVVTLRSRMAELRQMIHRGQLERWEAVEFRWGDAGVRARVMAMAKIPAVAAQLALGRGAVATIRAALVDAVEDVIAELRYGSRGRPGAIAAQNRPREAPHDAAPAPTHSPAADGPAKRRRA